MKKIMSILTILVVGILILSGVVMAGVTSNNATKDNPTSDNSPPGKPKVRGPTYIKPGTHEWTFGAIDPDGDNVSYQILWGDGTITDWFGPYPSGEEIKHNHTYYNYGTYTVKARAKDTHGAIGDWGRIPVISQSPQMIIPIFFQFVERFIERFPMIK